MSRKKVDISALNLEAIGDRITYIRTIKKLNQKEFGDVIGITKGNVSCFENHKYAPSFDVLVKISERFSVNPEWLLFGRGNIFYEPQKKIERSGGGRPPHSVIFYQFQQRDLAWEINWQALKLERLKPDALSEVNDFIQFKIGMYDRRRGERRRQDTSEFDPNEERRSGLDRRKAVGS